MCVFLKNFILKREGMSMRSVWICVLLVLCMCVGCSSAENQPFEDSVVSEVRTTPVYDWGVTLTAENVTPTGLTIVCTQSGGDPAGELQTGSYYTVQKLVEDRWESVEYAEIDEEQVGWTGEAWLIPMDSSVEWEVNWQWLYGALPAGQYRIGKEIMDFVETGNYEKAMFFAEFTIA